MPLKRAARPPKTVPVPLPLYCWEEMTRNPNLFVPQFYLKAAESTSSTPQGSLSVTVQPIDIDQKGQK
ncbi:MAG: hypothetical protein QM730_06730 [Anaerolineales bacterium]